MMAILSATRDGGLDAEVVGAILTRTDSPAFEVLRAEGVEPIILSPKALAEDYAKRLMTTLSDLRPDMICLCGYMRLLPTDIIHAFSGRIINIHPALLPKYGGKGMYGMRVHEAVLAAGDTESGCSVHYVDEVYDHGEIILQSRVPVMPDDTPESLAARILPIEHDTYVRGISMAIDRIQQ